MNIGEEQKIHRVEPARVPVPERETAPARPYKPAVPRKEPDKAPARPRKVPVKR
jgi:hypothetical protein